MSNITITKKDVIWGYIAQFFSIGSNLIILPFALRMLSAEEIGMNYLILTIGSLVSLFDFGFAPQFGRNITYIFSGAQSLKHEGINVASDKLNYKLLATTIAVAKSVYRILAALVLIVMLTLGSAYIYKVTYGFTNVDNSLIIWIIYSTSVFFNIYYSYYTSLLTGRGLIMESKKSILASRVVYVLLSFIALIMGWGLLGISLSNLISPFVGRFLSYHYFFTPDLRKEISIFRITRYEKWELFKIIWYNAKKIGLVFLGSYAITKFGMFLAGLYLTLDEVASYGLMIQLVSVITMVSVTLFSVSGPHFSALRIAEKRDRLIVNFAFTMNIYYCLFILGCFFLVVLGPTILKLIGTNVHLPSVSILILYSVIVLLENNHSNFAAFIVTGNKIPFVKSSLISGVAIAIGSFVSLKYTNIGILGLVLVQGFCQLCYSNWKWPYVVCRDFNLSYSSFLLIGMKESLNKLKLHYGK